jgi:crooked neck
MRREGIEDVVLSKRRFTYEQEIAQNPLNYDAWFDYVKLEESTGNHERIREVCGMCCDGIRHLTCSLQQ